ncbi:hypothetical protein [Nitrosospira sp. Nsp13]|jgi:hypothetical protein|uniref:hypothetical protein n=1 Tax=Nitrosospira sp. Nsp13 TaxID=1855332 RepID=UPI0008822298|nr:hypothetical protein [Nitrosospira sp. Nsp13]SCY55067.1 hypothetical protein SAMN05216308_1175 [Nitrosospira sp. Nsp13]
MKTKLGNIFAALSLVGLLASLSPFATAAEPLDTPEIRAAAQKAVTRSDHVAVAKLYEDAVQQMQVKVKEQKELLEHYENKSYLYGRQAQHLQSHAEALVRHYEQTVSADIQLAGLHRQIASKLSENYASSRNQALNR